jgi:hypothetical protein
MHPSEVESLRALVEQGVLTEAEFKAITVPSVNKEPVDVREATLRMTLDTLLSSAPSVSLEADPSCILSAHLLQVLKSERVDERKFVAKQHR